MGDQSFESRLEMGERSHAEPDLKADFIRHGKPEYTDEEIRSGNFEGSLSKDAASQVEKGALELAGQIDKEREIVVFWVSPRRRAQLTAEVISRVFREQNVAVIEGNRTKKSLADVRLGGKFMEEFSKNEAVGSWMEYWANSDLPEETEKPQKVKERVGRTITFLERIARKVNPQDNKKLHFVCVGHEEIFRDLLEEGFEAGTKKDTGPSYGEVMGIGVFKSDQDNDAVLKLNYRGQKAELGFNKESRRFYREDSTPPATKTKAI